MQIHSSIYTAYNLYALKKDTADTATLPGVTAGTAKTRSASLISEHDQEQARADKSRELSAQARELSARSHTFTMEQHRISFEGKQVAPEDRLSLEGVTAEYLLNMSDSEYLTALRAEEVKYSRASIALHYQAWDISDPAGKAERDAKLSGKPSFADADEARSMLSSYTDTLSGLIKTRNQFYGYATSDSIRSYLTDRFGEEEATARIGRAQQTIDDHDKQIENTLRSLRATYAFSTSTPIATNENGLWTMNPVSGLYINGTVLYQFDISASGQVQDL